MIIILPHVDRSNSDFSKKERGNFSASSGSFKKKILARSA